MSDEITIRRAETIADYRACQAAQRLAWGIDDGSYVVPIATLVGAQLHGGVVLGAFLPGGEAAGLSFAFLGRVEGRPCLYSQLTGVVPGYQGRGLGGRLKYAQRDHARAEGIERIAWAFDPLQAGNAHFNLGRLGASAGRYVVDMYGPRTDALNAGTPTDRLIAEWETDLSPRSDPIPEAGSASIPLLIDAGPDGAGYPVVGVLNDETPAHAVLLEVPEDIQALRRRDPALADSWRKAVRQAFLSSFAAGYRAVGLLRDETGGARRSFYILQRDDRP